MTEQKKYVVEKLNHLLKGTKTCLNSMDKIGTVASIKYPLQDIYTYDDIDMKSDYPNLYNIYEFYITDECYNLSLVELKQHRKDIKQIFKKLTNDKKIMRK